VMAVVVALVAALLTGALNCAFNWRATIAILRVHRRQAPGYHAFLPSSFR
jgi:hypothetical protein